MITAVQAGFSLGFSLVRQIIDPMGACKDELEALINELQVLEDDRHYRTRNMEHAETRLAVRGHVSDGKWLLQIL